MRQGNLFHGRSRQTVAGRVEGYRLVNLECARIIAGDPVKYPPGSLPAVWAALVLEGVEREPRAWGLVA